MLNTLDVDERHEDLADASALMATNSEKPLALTAETAANNAPPDMPLPVGDEDVDLIDLGTSDAESIERPVSSLPCRKAASEAFIGSGLSAKGCEWSEVKETTNDSKVTTSHDTPPIPAVIVPKLTPQQDGARKDQGEGEIDPTIRRKSRGVRCHKCHGYGHGYPDCPDQNPRLFCIACGNWGVDLLTCKSQDGRHRNARKEFRQQNPQRSTPAERKTNIRGNEPCPRRSTADLNRSKARQDKPQTGVPVITYPPIAIKIPASSQHRDGTAEGNSGASASKEASPQPTQKVTLAAPEVLELTDTVSSSSSPTDEHTRGVLNPLTRQKQVLNRTTTGLVKVTVPIKAPTRRPDEQMSAVMQEAVSVGELVEHLYRLDPMAVRRFYEKREGTDGQR